MALIAPALPSISLHGGQQHQDRIRKTILSVIPADGITYEALFDALASESPENSTWMVAHMQEIGEIKEHQDGLIYA